MIRRLEKLGVERDHQFDIFKFFGVYIVYIYQIK